MRMIVSGGGTGGHIYPGLALIDALKEKNKNSEVLYVGSDRGLEGRIVPELGIKFKALEIQGFKRKLFSTYNMKTMYLFMKSVHESKKIIKEFKPDVVVGTGGYVSGAVVYAAAKLGVPTVIHEQNSIVGLTNRFLSKYVSKVAIAFEDARKQFPETKVVYTGNPRAQQVANVKSEFKWSKIGLKDDVPTVLIFGGSQGAMKINSATVEAIPEFNKRDYQVVFVTGQKRYDGVKDMLQGVSVNKNIAVLPYIHNMPELLPEVSLIVGRAGATSIAEITSIGIASILVPSPYVTADHQTKNAMSLVKRNAAVILTENDLNGQSLVTKVDALMKNKDLRNQMATNSYEMGVRDAADRLLKVTEEVTKNGKKKKA